MEFISKNIEETAQIASDFTQTLLNKSDFASTATIVGLYGELGSGKTTFMKYLAPNFGIKETIQSPTFVIMKFFNISIPQSFHKLIHIDAYRLEKPEELLNLGWSHIIADPQNLICVEWPEKIEGIMPPHIVIKFEHVSENVRKIIYSNEKDSKEILRVDKN